MTKPRLLLSKSDYEGIVSFIAKKFAFDEMMIAYTTSQEEKNMIEGKLRAADLLFQKLEKHPHYITESTAKWIVAFLMETTTAYKGSVIILNRLGHNDTKEFDEELKIAEQLREKINEFLIDCIKE